LVLEGGEGGLYISPRFAKAAMPSPARYASA
jgi:hypothetical protein